MSLTTMEELDEMLEDSRIYAIVAQLKQGKIPDDHPTRESSVDRFMAFRNELLQYSESSPFKITCMPFSYPPCVLSVRDLRPIYIADLQLETHHRGRRLTVRAITSPHRINGVTGIVEDEQGLTTTITLYNQPDEVIVPNEIVWQEGGCYIIKEPFFKLGPDRSYSVRLDHPSDLVLLHLEHDLLPKKWQWPCSKNSDAFRKEGDQSVAHLKWAEAEALYTQAIETAKSTNEAQLAYLNRALTNLKLERPAKAVQDAINSHSDEEFIPTEKALFREASALYDLQQFDKCKVRLQKLSQDFPSSDAFQELFERVQSRLREQSTGEYNFKDMYRQSMHTPPLIDCATYNQPVKIAKSPGRGNGLYTTQNVVSGDLLVCEKAFAYIYADNEHKYWLKGLVSLGTDRVVLGGAADLISQIVQKLYHDPRQISKVYELSHGDYPVPPVTQQDGVAVVDTFLIERVLLHTCFESPRSSKSMFNMDSPESKKTDFYTAGIWNLAARINHSCVGNCSRSFIGDMQIIRATKDLEAGTELTFSYRDPEMVESYAKTQEELNRWGFVCECSICLERKHTPQAVFDERAKTVQTDDSTWWDGYCIAEEKLRQLNLTYSEKARALGGIRPEMVGVYMKLSAFYSSKDPQNGLNLAIQGLEALGFVIDTSVRTGDLKTEARFDIKEWGLHHSLGLLLLNSIQGLIQTLAPGLHDRVVEYMRQAYKMEVGEDVTFYEYFPNLLKK